MNHEVITLQFGNYSNYIGTHYWNIQQSQFVYSSELNSKSIPDVNHDILFREGVNVQNKPTYSPRMLLFDLKENINDYKSVNGSLNLERERENVNTWKGKLQVFESEKKPISPYSVDYEQTELEQINWEESEKKIHKPKNYLKDHYDMDEQVKYWSDYSNLKFNDRSYNLINQYDTATIENEPFDLFIYGSNLFSENNFLENFEDNLRHFAEECDNIQGFQFFVDSFNGFGGMAHKALNVLNEEYPKLPFFSFFSFPYFDVQNIENNTHKLLNSALTLKNILNEKSDNIIVPLSLFDSFYLSKQLNPIKLPNIKYKPELEYHTSSILASLIDSITLPWRQKSQKLFMNHIIDLMDVYKYKIASLQAAFPLDMGKNNLFNYLQENDLFKNSSWFTPFGAENYLKSDDTNLPGAFALTCRGVDNKSVKNPNDNYYFKGFVSASSVLDKYSLDMYPKSRSKCFSIDTKLNVDIPFPDIFEAQLKNNDESLKKEISLISMLQVNKSVFGFINFLTENTQKINVNKYRKHFENGMELDDFNELNVFNRDLTDMYSV